MSRISISTETTATNDSDATQHRIPEEIPGDASRQGDGDESREICTKSAASTSVDPNGPPLATTHFTDAVQRHEEIGREPNSPQSVVVDGDDEEQEVTGPDFEVHVEGDVVPPPLAMGSVESEVTSR